jgi:hypothetical protein
MWSIKVSFLILLSGFLFLGCYRQSEDSVIKNITREVQTINNNKSLKAVKLENEGFLEETLDNGSSLTGFYKGDTIYKMNVWIGLSYCIRQYYYYFNDRQIIFIYETEDDFPDDPKTGELNYSIITRTFEGKYYLNNGKIVNMTIKGKKRLDNMPSTKFISGLETDANSYIKLLKPHLFHK